MEDTTSTTITEPMIFPNGEVTVEFTQSRTFTAHAVPVQAIVEAVRKAAQERGVDVEEPDTLGGLWDLQDCGEYVNALLGSQDSQVLLDVLDALRDDGAEVEEDDAVLDGVQNA